MAGRDEVYMDIPAVREISKTFQTVTDVLRGVVTALDAIVQMLNTAAFMGLVGAAMIARFVDIIKRQLDDLADKTEEISGDVAAAADGYEAGDATGATRFY